MAALSDVAARLDVVAAMNRTTMLLFEAAIMGCGAVGFASMGDYGLACLSVVIGVGYSWAAGMTARA